MPRNLNERVEVLVPIKDPMLRERVLHEILECYLADTLKTRVLLKDGTYERIWKLGSRNPKPPTGDAAFNAQEFLIALAEGKEGLQGMPVVTSRTRSKKLRSTVGKDS